MSQPQFAYHSSYLSRVHIPPVYHSLYVPSPNSSCLSFLVCAQSKFLLFMFPCMCPVQIPSVYHSLFVPSPNSSCLSFLVCVRSNSSCLLFLVCVQSKFLLFIIPCMCPVQIPPVYHSLYVPSPNSSCL